MPMKFIAMQNSKKKYLFIILGMIIFAIAENIVNFFFQLTLTYSNTSAVNATANETTFTLNYICYSSFYLTLGSGIASLLFRNFIPFIIMFIFNVLIIFHVYQNHLKLNKTYRARGHKHFFISIMTINLLFFILYLPWSIAQIIVLVQFFFTARNVTQSVNPGIIFFYNVGWSVSYLNYIFPFFVYIKFNRLFRTELFAIVHVISKEKDSSNVDGKTTTKVTTKSGTTTRVGPRKNINTVSGVQSDLNTVG